MYISFLKLVTKFPTDIHRHQIEVEDLLLIILSQVAGCTAMLKPNVPLPQMIIKVDFFSLLNIGIYFSIYDVLFCRLSYLVTI